MIEKKPAHDGNVVEEDAVTALARSIAGLAKELGVVQERARELGIFVDDRELVSCPRCGLVEDVLADGRLVTSWPDSLGHDTGMRFVEATETPGRFTCPECGCEAVPDEPGEVGPRCDG